MKPSTDQSAPAGHSGWLSNCFPIVDWITQYQRPWLRADLIAGLTVWAVIVPESMAYASIAGVPALYGLYSVPIPLFLYAILGTSRTMVVGPDTATAMISATAIGALAASGSQDYITLTACMAMLVGVLFLLFGLLRMGWIANFVPTPVMKGFIQGLVWVTIVGQLPKLLGVEGSGGNFFEKLGTLSARLSEANPASVAIGLGSLAGMAVLKSVAPRFPAALSVAAIAILVSVATGLSERGVDVVGVIPAGLPGLHLPICTWTQVQAIIPAALAIVLLGFSETLGAARAAAERTGETLDANQELISHGPANMGSALCGGFIVVGSLSKTSVAMSAGAKTQLTSIVAGLLVLLSLMFLLPLFQSLPHPTLAAIVIEAMLGLASFRYLKNLRSVNATEFCVAFVALLGVLTIGVLQGIGLGVLISLVLMVRRFSFPSTAILGRLPGQEMYRDVRLHPEAEEIPGVLIFRFESDLIYTNATHFDQQLGIALQRCRTPVTCVIVDAESISTLDSTAMEMLQHLIARLSNRGVRLLMARLRDPVRDLMQRGGLEALIGPENFYQRITDAVNSIEPVFSPPRCP